MSTRRQQPAPWRRRLLAMAPAMLLAGTAAAAAPGVALVVGIDGPPGSPGRMCSQLARDVGAQLKRQGIVPQVLDNPSVTALRSGIDDIAAAISGAAQDMALAYVCAPASVDGSRLFVMPSGTAPAAGAALAAQGVIVQAFLNALAGTGATVFADLALPGGAAPGDAARTLAERLPAGLHLALNLSPGGEPWIGQGLAGNRITPGQAWGTVAAGIGAGHPRDGILLLLPVAVPVVAAPVTTSAEPPPSEPLRPTAAEPPSPAPPRSSAPPQRPAPMQPAGGDAPAAPPARAEREATAPAPKPARNAAPGPDRPASVPRSSQAEAGQAGPRPSEADAPPPPPGQPDTRTRRLQAALARQGFYRGPADGRPGAPTQGAVRQFQRSLGAAETGEMTQSEIIRLLNQ